MNQPLQRIELRDEQGRPAGGSTKGVGIDIVWQNGPLGRHAEGCVDKDNGCVEGCTRVPQNGAFVEGVITAALGRLQFYQDSQFACEENTKAIIALQTALDVLNSRTQRREADKTEGTHNGS